MDRVKSVLARVRSAAVIGLDAVPVDVEVDVSPGLPGFAIVGLPDAAVREARERVRSAVRNSGFEMPARRITVNLAPADTRKAGPAFDLPIALGILGATEQIPGAAADGYVMVGELSLDGTVRPVAGVLNIALAVRRLDSSGLVVPEANAEEASIVHGLAVHAAGSLGDLGRALRGGRPLCASVTQPGAREARFPDDVDFAEVKGHGYARRALEIAAAGAHNLLMIGPPGAGKTMLARRLPTILPPLTHAEAIEVTRIYSVAAALPERGSLVTARPFRIPHHGASLQALVGGGTFPRPGEVSLAHLGVLFLDELPEFRGDALEALRQPMEEGCVVVARAHATVAFPARCMVVAAMNPCRCGYYGDALRPCVCTPGQRSRYLGRVSGPLLDRVDLQVEVHRLTGAELTAEAHSVSSDEMRSRVVRARAVQAARAAAAGTAQGAEAGTAALTNGTIPLSLARSWCRMNGDVRSFLEAAIDRLGLSPRAADRVIRVARTIADLEDAPEIGVPHVAEAIGYRALDRRTGTDGGAMWC